MDYQNVCDTLRKTYNINFLDLDENKIIGQEFAKAAEIYKDSKKGNKVLIDLIYNHYNVKKPFPDFIGGPQTVTMHWSNRWKKLIYIFGEQHSNEIDCEKRLNTKKWVPIQNFLEDLILKTDVYIFTLNLQQFKNQREVITIVLNLFRLILGWIHFFNVLKNMFNQVQKMRKI